MKKIIFTMTFAILFVASQLFGQGLLLESTIHGELANGDEINVLAGPNTTQELELIIHVKNNSDAEKLVKVAFEITDQVTNSTHTFCWAGGCLPPEITEANATMDPQEMLEMSGHYNMLHEGEFLYGTTTVKYTFTELEEGKDNRPIVITVNYIVNMGFEERAIALLTPNDLPVQHDEEYLLQGNTSESMLVSHFKVKNNTNENINVLVKRERIELLYPAIDSFCWGSCYDPSVDVSPRALTINAGASLDNDFSGDYEHHNAIGESKIKYTFFLANNPYNATSVYVIYKVEENTANSISLMSNGIDVTNQELTVNGTPSDSELISTIKVKNMLDTEQEILISKEIISTNADFENTFTFAGDDFPSTIEETPFPYVLAGGSETEFSGHLLPNNIAGEAVIKYSFWNKDNADEKFFVTVNYIVKSDGINEYEQVFETLKAYPIPTDNILNIDYKFKQEDINARIVILNILGETIYTQKMNVNNEQISINTSNLENGMYFYSILNGNQNIISKKFIVSH